MKIGPWIGGSRSRRRASMKEKDRGKTFIPEKVNLARQIGLWLPDGPVSDFITSSGQSWVGQMKPLPEPGGPPLPPPKGPIVAIPDFIWYQKLACLDASPGSALVKYLSKVIQVPEGDLDIRVNPLDCTKLDEKDQWSRLALWVGRPASRAESDARQQALDNSAFGSGLPFAFFFGYGLVQNIAWYKWNAAKKDYTIASLITLHLTGYDFQPVLEPAGTFSREGKFITRYYAYSDTFWPPVNFTLTLQDTLTAQDQLTISTSSSVDADASLLQKLAAEVPGPLSQIFGTEGEFVDIGGEVVTSLPQGFGGIGAYLRGSLPTSLLLKPPPVEKLVFHYYAINLTAAGFIFGGIDSKETRNPTVSIAGPTNLSVIQQLQGVRASYAITTTDLNTYRNVTWSVGPDMTVVAQFADGSANMAIHLPNKSKPGDVILQSISVQVTDTDGFSAHADLQISIRVATIAHPPPHVPPLKPIPE